MFHIHQLTRITIVFITGFSASSSETCQ